MMRKTFFKASATAVVAVLVSTFIGANISAAPGRREFRDSKPGREGEKISNRPPREREIRPERLNKEPGSKPFIPELKGPAKPAEPKAAGKLRVASARAPKTADNYYNTHWIFTAKDGEGHLNIMADGSWTWKAKAGTEENSMSGPRINIVTEGKKQYLYLVEEGTPEGFPGWGRLLIKNDSTLGYKDFGDFKKAPSPPQPEPCDPRGISPSKKDGSATEVLNTRGPKNQDRETLLKSDNSQPNVSEFKSRSGAIFEKITGVGITSGTTVDGHKIAGKVIPGSLSNNGKVSPDPELYEVHALSSDRIIGYIRVMYTTGSRKGTKFTETYSLFFDANGDHVKTKYDGTEDDGWR